MVVLLPNLAEVRKQILAGTFSAKQQKKCSLSQAHQEIVGASSPCLRSTCHCNKGQCRATDVVASAISVHAVAHARAVGSAKSMN